MDAQPVSTPRAAARPDVVRPDVVLPDRLDVTTVEWLRDELQVALDAGPDDLVIDCAAVEVVDAAGLGLLMSTHRRATFLSRRLVLLNPQPRLLRLLAVTRLHRVLHLDRLRAVTRQ